MSGPAARCPVCGREFLNQDGPWSAQCFREAPGYTDKDCYRLGYERQRARAEKLEKALRAEGSYLIRDAKNLRSEAAALRKRGEEADAMFRFGCADYAESIGNKLLGLAEAS